MGNGCCSNGGLWKDGEMKGKWSNGGRCLGDVESMCANEEGVALG